MMPRLFSLMILLSLIVHAHPPAAAAETPPPWISYQKWQEVDLSTSYYTLEFLTDGRVGLWFDAHFQGHDAVIHLVGRDPSALERVLPRFDARLIRGYDQDLGNRASPLISRSSATRLQDGSVLVLASIGPAYDGGRSELYPALFHSPNGVDNWKHLGPPSGEPADWLAERRQAGQRIRCEGGGIIQLPDGRLRMYNQNLGARLAILEADAPEGPWHFVRDEQGQPRNALEGLSGGWLFPQVNAIGRHGYLLTGGNTWPPSEIHAAISNDGYRFVVPGQAPGPAVVFRPQWADSEAKSAKTLRVAWDAEQERLLAMGNILEGRSWSLFWTWATIDLGIFSSQE